jgi:SEC-C motif
MSSTIGRNHPCPCRSGLRFKRCCGRLVPDDRSNASPQFFDIRDALARQAAHERMRQDQQGLGRPITAFKANGHQVVVVGDTVHFSQSWKTVPDFLAYYIKTILEPPWGNAELAKPFSERHPIIQWYDAVSRHQQATITSPGEPTDAIVTGAVACYLGLGYGLYLLAHNVEQQKRLIDRLKNPGTFQGAYYEVIVASLLIRAGFELTLEDETDGASTHGEFIARSKRTGKKYWVEAKARSVAGLLAKTTIDGTSDTKPTSHLVKHLNLAFKKTAPHERLIFVDLNTEPTGVAKPAWIEQAAARLEAYEKQGLPKGERAYVIVTNFAFHRALSDPASMVGFPMTLGIDDFNRPAIRRPSDAYRLKQKHIDMHHIGQVLANYARIPATFDGSLPSDTFNGAQPRIMIGDRYCFGDPAKGAMVGTVTTAVVTEATSEVYFRVTDQNGCGHLVKEPMTPRQLAEYRMHKDSYFGRVLPVGGQIDDPFELFERFVENHKWMSRAQLLEKLAFAPNIDTLRSMGDDDLLYEFCELLVASAPSLKK